MFIPFAAPVGEISLPEKFTFPFYYEPHPLCRIAATELQKHLQTQTDWEHNFGIKENREGLIIGKMFGILVVQKSTGELGYLWAFSGKLANQNHHPNFVPPVFDMLTKDGFFKKEEAVLNELNRAIEVLENSKNYQRELTKLNLYKELSDNEISQLKTDLKQRKKDRDQQRKTARKTLSDAAYNSLLENLRQESIRGHFQLKDLKKAWQQKMKLQEEVVAPITAKIEDYKKQRKAKSAALQKRLFQQYQFLNSNGETSSLLDIFTPTPMGTPPAGAGECAAPKLLQYAYQHQFRPVAMAEFWWGQSPKSEIRRHGQFYPACRSKCEPILNHMLQGLTVADNPMLVNPAIGKDLPVIYEDSDIIVVNKPSEFLSVPGKNISDSVLQRIKQQYPDIKGPVIVHRLDMSTSGIMVLARNPRAYKRLQFQFIRRLIKKRYVAVLEGTFSEEAGIIELPLRVDFDNRPQQLVCYEYGKAAKTHWKVIERFDDCTRVHFFPVTGRTHQLRVHAAHPSGLNTPILGDDLYGNRDKRLHLHAEWIELQHPTTKEIITFEISADF